MKIDTDAIFTAARTGDWTKIPLDMSVMGFVDERGDTPAHIAARAGLMHKVPRELRLGMFHKSDHGVIAAELITAEDRDKMMWADAGGDEVEYAKIKLRTRMSGQAMVLN